MKSEHNQMTLDKKSRRLKQLFFDNQQFQTNRLFYIISIGRAIFSAIKTKSFKLLILGKNVIRYLDGVFFSFNHKKHEKSLDTIHQILLNEITTAAPDESYFLFLSRV